MTSKLKLILFFLEIVLFILGTGVLVYFAENSMWNEFWIVGSFCLIIFLVLKLIEIEPIRKKLKIREAENQYWVKKFEELGIENVFNMHNSKEIHRRNIENIKIIEQGNNFCLSGSTGTSYLNPTVRRHWDYVRKKLEDGAPFRFLLTNPLCESKEIRNKLNKVRTIIDPKLDIHNLIELQNKYPNFEVRITSEVYCSIFYTDNHMMYDPYHLGQVRERLENHFFAMKIKKTDGDDSSYFNQLRNHFEYLWKEGKLFEQFFEENREKFK
jgi:hypothetical protein